MKKTLVILVVVIAGIVFSALFLPRVPAREQGVASPAGESFSTTWDHVNFCHDLFSGVLSDYVDDEGLVDYAGFRSDRRFQEYLFRLANTQPAKFADDHARLAFWINAYNAFAIQGVLETLPADQSEWSRFRVIDVKIPQTRLEGTGFFTGIWHKVGGDRVTLDEIEKGFLLHRSQWVKKDRARYVSMGVSIPDPRIHFALVCAAKGCVKLRKEVYDAATIDQQLDNVVRDFLRDRSRIRIHLSAKKIQTSELLKWYQRDFVNPKYEPHADTLVKFLAKYVENHELADSLHRDRWKISYFDYDWNLNLQP